MPQTRYEHDESGRLVSSTPEAEWDEEQQALMLALAVYRASRCEGCGGDLAETTSHEQWNVPPPMRCHRCTAIAIAQDAHDHKHLHALRWTATPRR